MHEQPPIPENEDRLFLNYINGWGDLITLAHTFDLTIDQFIQWADSDDVRTRVDAFAKSATLRAKAILAGAHIDAINALLKIILAPPPQTDDPKILAAAQETTRKAAALLFRVAQQQTLGDEPDQPQDPTEDPDDDPETDPSRATDLLYSEGLCPLPIPTPGATTRCEAAQLCDCNPDTTNSQQNVHISTPLPSLKGSTLIAECPPPGGRSVDGTEQNDPGGVGPTIAHTRSDHAHTKRPPTQSRGFQPARGNVGHETCDKITPPANSHIQPARHECRGSDRMHTLKSNLPTLKGSALIAEGPPPGGPSVDSDLQNDPVGVGLSHVQTHTAKTPNSQPPFEIFELFTFKFPSPSPPPQPLHLLRALGV